MSADNGELQEAPGPDYNKRSNRLQCTSPADSSYSRADRPVGLRHPIVPGRDLRALLYCPALAEPFVGRCCEMNLPFSAAI